MSSAQDCPPGPAPEGSREPSRFVIVSGYHDYRSKRRVNLHFVADELGRRGTVFFLSLRYSLLTRWSEDPRHDLAASANTVEQVGRVSCFLWRTPIHPFGLPPAFRLLERVLFGLFARRLPRPARAAIADADVIFVESGIALIHLPLIRRLNPRAEVVYLASDALGAINQAHTIHDALRRHAPLIDSARLPSPLLRDDVPAGIPCFLVPHGVDAVRLAAIGPSPYRPGSANAVSVGSMLFDPGFFRVAAAMFPNVNFHIIGSGHDEAGPDNVIYHPEMPFTATLPFIKHANVAVAAYGRGVAPYLAHTSMKLMQYGALGVPAVCPEAVVGGTTGRFGYVPGDRESLRRALSDALSIEALPPQPHLSWQEVTDRWLRPIDFPDTALEAADNRADPPPGALGRMASVPAGRGAGSQGRASMGDVQDPVAVGGAR